MSPLVAAAHNGSVGVVRVLISGGRAKRRAVWGDVVLAQALRQAVVFRRPKVLRVLLTADGEERRAGLANAIVRGKYLLHFAAGYCRSAAVSILLEAGAAEAALDAGGNTPQEAIGTALDRDELPAIRENAVAIRRMLRRGPAYRARSWAWPSDDEEEADAGGGGDGSDGDVAAAAVLASPPEVLKSSSVTRVRIFRPKDEESSSNFFVRLVSR